MDFRLHQKRRVDGQQSTRLLIAEGRFPGTYKLDPKKQTSPYRIPIQDIEAFEQARQVSLDSR
jgi:hypothetical protein